MRHGRLAAALLAGCWILGSVPLAAADVIIDGSQVTAAKTDGGGYEAEVSFINTTTDAVALPVPSAADCAVQWKEADSLAPLEATSLTLLLDAGCFPEGSEAESIVVDIDASTGDRTVTVKRPASTSLDWTPLGVGLVFGVAAALAVAWWGRKALSRASTELSGSRTEREGEFVVFRSLLNGWLSSGSGRPFTVVDSLPGDERYGWSSAIDGLDAGWSFKDSWVSTASAGTAALVAFLTSTDAFTTLLGEAPKQTLGVLTIAGLLTAIVLALANLVVKMAGEDVSVVTVRGLVSSTALVAFATAFQIAALTWGAVTVLTGTVAEVVVVSVGLVVGVVVMAYVLASLEHGVLTGMASQFPVIPAAAPMEWSWEHDWQRALIAQAMMKTYQKWIGPPPPPAVPDGVDMEPMPEELVPVRWLTSDVRQRASMP